MDMSLCVVDRKKEELEFAGAMNPLLVVRDSKAELIKGDRQPIGGANRKNRKPFSKHTIPLDGKSNFYIYSDGYKDQFGGDDNMKLNAKTFRKRVTDLSVLPMEDQQKAHEKFLDDWIEAAATDQMDDILVIGFRA